MLLDRIKSCADVRRLRDDELPALAGELRTRITEVVATNGGHLASNLGVIELTIALHRAFDCPADHLVWDVGHQCYAHKIITGRGEMFGSVRQAGGLSGFPKREESCFDAFNTGHSTTSISAALGLLVADRMRGIRSHGVAVIGDGALTGGMAWEAMNHAAHIGAPLIVVLNDNEMSISPNVGAISTYLNRLRTTRSYRRVKERSLQMLQAIPLIGRGLTSLARRVKGGIRYLFVQGALFEELGFTYIGPVDGHDLADLADAFTRAKALGTPVLVHCVTRKGKGYTAAEERPDRFHSAAPFVVATGRNSQPKNGRSFTEVFGDSLLALAEQHDDIAAVSAAMIDGTGLTAMASAMPDRVFDVGIAEPHGVTFAAGLACRGMRPVVVLYSTFLQRAYDQALHDVCLQRLPVIFAIDRAGVVGEDGPTHHGVYDISYLRTMPGLRIMAPAGAWDMEHVLAAAIGRTDGPTALRYPRDGAGTAYALTGWQEQGMLISGDADVLLIGVGPLYAEARRAAELLCERGTPTSVYYAPCLWPLPEALLEAAERARLVITAEDNILAGGFGSAVGESLLARGYNGKLVSLGHSGGDLHHAPRRQLLEQAGLTAEQMVGVVDRYAKATP